MTLIRLRTLIRPDMWIPWGTHICLRRITHLRTPIRPDMCIPPRTRIRLRTLTPEGLSG